MISCHKDVCDLNIFFYLILNGMANERQQKERERERTKAKYT